LVRRLNVDGDGQGDLAGHGGEHRTVLVYQIASYLRLANCYFWATTGHLTLLRHYVLSGWLVRPYVHPPNVPDFKGIRAGYHFR